MESNKIKQLETICAPATANGTSAIGIIRVTGEKAIEIVREVFRTFKGKKTELYFSIKPKVKIGYIIDSNKNIIERRPERSGGRLTSSVSAAVYR